ncbi:MAG: hypothetical protein XXXJIFNMEKO3_01677 [Candidatus Erwinia impunctatus]|nr:hypothetical protein XXXJIFNMEKO_01677 [Culicoides impunctatus]
MKCLIAPYMGRCLQPNGLIDLPQVWGYVFSPMESSLQVKRKGPYGPFPIIKYYHPTCLISSAILSAENCVLNSTFTDLLI